MKLLRILAISSALILMGIVIMTPTDRLVFKLIVEGVLVMVAIGWYSAKELRI